jgi:hypothetical protein
MMEVAEFLWWGLVIAFWSSVASGLIYLWADVRSPQTTAAPARLTHDKTYRLNDPTFTACKSRDDYHKIVELSLAHDHDAVVAFLAPRLRSRVCAVLRQAQDLTVTDRAILDGAVCVRPRGDPDCYWLPELALNIGRQ